MSKVLFVIAGVLIVLSVLLFVSGFSAQQPLAFVVALVCTFPGAAFVAGGAVFSLFSRYQLVPRDEPVQVRANHRRARSISTPEPLN